MAWVRGVKGVAIVAVASMTLVAGCARREVVAPAHHYGSIKDDYATERPAPAPRHRPRAEASPRPQAVATAVPPPAPPPAVSQPTAAPAVTPPPAVPARPPEAGDSLATERQLEEGRKLFALGKVIDARKRFIAAMNGPIPEALLALARSFDTFYLSQLPSSDGAPDMSRALTLYERAQERGSTEAAADIERVKAIFAAQKNPAPTPATPAATPAAPATPAPAPAAPAPAAQPQTK